MEQVSRQHGGEAVRTAAANTAANEVGYLKISCLTFFKTNFINS